MNSLPGSLSGRTALLRFTRVILVVAPYSLTLNESNLQQLNGVVPLTMVL
ncbi:hypothetical protein LZ22198_MCBDPFMK_00031 [Levilactobacillus zymae]